MAVAKAKALKSSKQTMMDHCSVMSDMQETAVEALFQQLYQQPERSRLEERLFIRKTQFNKKFAESPLFHLNLLALFEVCMINLIGYLLNIQKEADHGSGYYETSAFRI